MSEQGRSPSVSPPLSPPLSPRHRPGTALPQAPSGSLPSHRSVCGEPSQEEQLWWREQTSHAPPPPSRCWLLSEEAMDGWLSPRVL